VQKEEEKLLSFCLQTIFVTLIKSRQLVDGALNSSFGIHILDCFSCLSGSSKICQILLPTFDSTMQNRMVSSAFRWAGASEGLVWG
jgi:hypothetical protein